MTGVGSLTTSPGAASSHAERSFTDRPPTPGFEGQRALLRIVAPKDALRPGLGVAAAADILYTIGSPESYRSLVLDRGWSPARFERWYADTLIRLLLTDGCSGISR